MVYIKNSKKAFTLAEILIVLMVIGVIATMSIPALMKGVNSSQFKATYSKAMNAIVNLTAAQKVSGSLPSRTSDKNADDLFDILVSNLAVKGYVPTSVAKLGGAEIISPDKVTMEQPVGDGRYKNWILTDDNFAYLITKSSGGAEDSTCFTKLEIIDYQANNTSGTTPPSADSGKTNDSLSHKACFVVYVDVNSVTSGPNTTFANSLGKNDKLPAIIDDTFPVYVGLDGATPGNQNTTITGRIAASLK